METPNEKLLDGFRTVEQRGTDVVLRGYDEDPRSPTAAVVGCVVLSPVAQIALVKFFEWLVGGGE